MAKGIKRLIPVLCCIVILISCLVVPASAMSPWVDGNDDSARTFFPVVGYHVTFSTAITSTYKPVTSVRGLDFCLPYATASSHWTNAVLAMPHSIDYGGIEPMENRHIVHQYIAQTSQVDDDFVYRVRERFRAVPSEGDYNFSFQHALVSIDDFGGTYDRYSLANFFWVSGKYTFVVSGTFYCIDDTGGLVVYPFKFSPFNSNGSQSILTQNYLNNIEKYTGVKAGDKFFISDLEISMTQIGGVLEFSRLAEVHQEFVTPESKSLYFTDLHEFLTARNLVTGYQPSVGETEFSSFLVTAVSGFFDAPIFGELTLGEIFTTIVILLVVLWLLKLIAGG